jgi:hypothetical protein
MADENVRPPTTGQSLKTLLDSLNRPPFDRPTSHLYDAARSMMRNTPI